jgi:hypothetical protein
MTNKSLLTFDKENEKFLGEHLTFYEACGGDWIIENKDPECLGRLEKVRVGAWMSWCLFLEDGCYLSASCQDEVREMTKILNAKNNKK